MNMNVKRFRTVILVCTIATLAFIWGNSLLPADVSGAESGRVMKLLAPVLHYIYDGGLTARLEWLAARLPGRAGPFLLRATRFLAALLTRIPPSTLVRKAAHFSEYMLFGFFLGLLFVRANGHGRIFLPWGGCLAAAGIDEAIQLFVSGRAGRVLDVCIDMSGATVGLITALLALLILRGLYREAGP